MSVSLEIDGESRYYELAFPAPSFCLTYDPVDLRTRMAMDGLSFGSVVKTLRAWVRAWSEDVEKVVIGHTGEKYTLGILLLCLTEQRVREIYELASQFCKPFHPHRPFVFVLGPQQRDSFLLSESDSYIVEASQNTPGGIGPE